jgi:hypothetical protein
MSFVHRHTIGVAGSGTASFWDNASKQIFDAFAVKGCENASADFGMSVLFVCNKPGTANRFLHCRHIRVLFIIGDQLLHEQLNTHFKHNLLINETECMSVRPSVCIFGYLHCCTTIKTKLFTLLHNN